jgi:hypothetical protein
MQLNINTNAVVAFTNKLEKMHKSALPSAIRGALNNTVFDVKTKTMPTESKSTFVNRQPNFFKANSRFEKASGFNMKQMKAQIGFIEHGLKGRNNYAVQDLQEQEHGGAIDRKSFIPLKAARISGNNNKNIRSNARLSSIKNIVNAKKVNGKNNKQKFIHGIAEAGKGGFVLSGKTLWKIDSFKKIKNKTVFKKTALYSFRKGRKVRVKGTHFMQNASLKSGSKIEGFYILEAQRQIQKLL